MKKIKAAIIDDGVASYHLKNYVSYNVLRDLTIIPTDAVSDFGIHGSLCMSVINKYMKNDNVDWLNICIINHETGFSSRHQFVKALELCRENKVKVIHMSLGTTEYEDFFEIESIVKQIIDEGTIIVAALSNNNKLTYPACLKNVIGVKTTTETKDDQLIYIRDSLENINFLASSKHLLKLPYGYEWTEFSNSFAAPVVTAKILNILGEYDNLNADEVAAIIALESENKPFINPFSKVTITNINVPIIGIYISEKENAEKIAEEICKGFISDEYAAVVCSCYDKDLFGFPEIDTIAQLKFLIDFSSCDVVIAIINEKTIKNFPLKFDVIVTDDQDDLYTISMNSYKVIEYNNNMNFNNIYNQIINNLND